MTSKVNRKQILEEFLKNIACLSDKNYQERVWIRAEGPECDDIDDTVCDFFDDGDFILKERKSFEITDNQLDALTKLYEKLRIFADDFEIYSPDKSTEILLKNPAWGEIRDLAKTTLSTFNYPKNPM